LLGKPHATETALLKELTSSLGLSERIVFKSYVPYDDLPNWYRGAMAFVYPSLWEGFGLPILEAMACGCPVITSAGSGMEEVSGGNAILINPQEIDSIASAIEKVLTSNTTRLLYCRLAMAHAMRYGWLEARKKTAGVIERLLDI